MTGCRHVWPVQHANRVFGTHRIEHTYNHRRRQRGLGKLTPVEFELAFVTRIEGEAG